MILSSFGRRLIALADAATVKAALGISSSTTVDNSNWSGTDLSVDNGGTGRSSHTAYAVLCGGTTTTGAQQSIASVGTSGHVLTSSGAGSLPAFQAPPAPNYGTGNAALGAGAVGTYALLARNPTGVLATGATIAGSNLEYTSASGTTSGASPSGTWRCMGWVSGSSSGAGTVSVFLRIS